MEPVPSTSNQGCKLHNKALAKLDDLKCAIRESDLNSVKTIIEFLLDEPNNKLLAELCKENEQCITHNLIIATCEHNQVDILHYLLHETDILEYLTNKTFNERQEDELRKKAFSFAMCSGDVRIVEILYDQWRGDMHWSPNDNNDGVIRLISRLGNLLKEAKDMCQEHVVKNNNMKCNVQCFIEFNQFQYTVYTKLNEILPQIVNSPGDETVNIAKEVITQVLCAYKDFSKIRQLQTIDVEEVTMQKLEDDTFYNEWWLYLRYEKYFIKLDFYVSMLILDNLNILKSKEVAPDISDEIECTIYHFIFRAYDDWRLYIPKNRTMEKHKCLAVHNGKKIEVVEEYDPLKINAVSVLFLERMKFKTCLDDFDMHTHKENLNLNYLKDLPYMRDYYSLMKTVYYMEVVEKDMNKKNINVLIIEKALLVIGEMTKTSDESYHLAPTTEALLQTEISVETIKNIRKIRDFISRVKEGQQTVRIEIAENKDNEHTFGQIQKDITKLTEAFKSVRDIHKLILDKSLLQNGVDLIEKRIEKWPSEASKYIDDIYKLLKEQDQAVITNYKKKHWKKSGKTEELFEEIYSTLSYKEDLSLKIQELQAKITQLGVSKLQKYISTIKHTHQHVRKNNQNWNSVKHEVNKYIKKKIYCYPALHEINYMNDRLSKLNKTNKNIDKDLLEKVKQINDITDHWESILNVLKFYLHEMKLWIKNGAKEKILTDLLSEKANDPISDDAIDTMDEVITLMEKDLSDLLPQNNSIDTGIATLSLNNAPQETFAGIEELSSWYIIENKKGKVDHRSNFKKRVAKLRNILGYPKAPSLSEHQRRYMRDPKFRSELEMLLTDLSNIYVVCKKRHLMKKSNKLLAGIDLRNVLEHGNPMLEVIGDVLDPLDFSAELLSKARRLAQDPDIIEAELFS